MHAAPELTIEQHLVHREHVGPWQHDERAGNMCRVVLHVSDRDGAVGQALEAQHVLGVAHGAEWLGGAGRATSHQAFTCGQQQQVE